MKLGSQGHHINLTDFVITVSISRFPLLAFWEILRDLIAIKLGII